MSTRHGSSDFKNLPETASLRQYCPRPGNQLQLNTSPAWATSWSALSIIDARKNQRKGQWEITQHTFSPAYTYFYIKDAEDENCQTGADLYKVLDFLKQSGTKTYSDFLEFCPKGIPEQLLPNHNAGQISGFSKLFESFHTDQFKINAVKKSIAGEYPVVIGMYCPPSFYSAKNFWQPTEYIDTSYPGHALCIVGYNDRKYGGAFEVINSWGSQWGNEGFIWIRYSDFVRFTKYAYEVFSMYKDPAGNHSFGGSIDLKLNTGKKIMLEQVANGIYQPGLPLKTGTYFRMYVRNITPAFVYVFGLDENGNYYKLFPHQDQISPALLYQNDDVAIPDEGNYIEIVGSPGRETLCLIYSKEALDFEGLLANLALYPGDVANNLDVLMPGKFLSPDALRWEKEDLSFDGLSKDRSAIFIQIKIVHI